MPGIAVARERCSEGGDHGRPTWVSTARESIGLAGVVVVTSAVVTAVAAPVAASPDVSVVDVIVRHEGTSSAAAVAAVDRLGGTGPTYTPR